MARESDVALGVAGVGLVGVAGYFLYRERLKHRLVEHYMEEADELIEFYERARREGRLGEEEVDRIIGIMVDAMTVKEVKIEREGLIPEILDRLNRMLIIIGHAVPPGFISAAVYKWLLRNRPPRPPTWKCEICRAIFGTEPELERHVREVHRVDMVRVPAAEVAFRGLSQTVQRMISALSGAGERIFQPWAELPMPLLLAIGVAIIILIVLMWWKAPVLAPAAKFVV